MAHTILNERSMIKQSMQTEDARINISISYFKEIFPRVFTTWFRGIDLTDAMFLRLYHLGSVEKKDVKTNSSGYSPGNFTIESLKALFVDNLGKLVIKDRIEKTRSVARTGNVKSAVVLVGGLSDLRIAEAIKGYAASNSGFLDSVTVVLKKRRLLDDFKTTGFFQDRQPKVISDLEYFSMPRHIYRIMRSKWMALAKRFMNLSIAQRQQCGFIIKELPVLLKLCWRANVLLDFRPVFIAGAFEKSALGCLVYDYAKAGFYNTFVINIQHGHNWIAPFLSRVRFDRFFVWDELTARNLERSGYNLLESIRVVGNPAWENTGAGFLKDIDLDRIEKLKKWKGVSPVILACLQPLDYDSRNSFRRIIFSYMEKNPDVKLFIRPHPADFLDTWTEWLPEEDGEGGKRIKILHVGEYGIETAFAFSEIVCCVNSAILHDALYARKPALSIDVCDELDDTDGRFYDSVKRCSSEEDAHGYIDKVFQGDAEIVYPQAPDFRRKLFFALAELGYGRKVIWLNCAKACVLRVVPDVFDRVKGLMLR